MSKLIIDASNLLSGGGVVHLKNLLHVANPQSNGFKKIIVYGGRIPLKCLPQRDWLDLREITSLNNSFFHRLQWQKDQLEKIAGQEKALLFVPGGLYLGKFRPFVTMFQNMQIFETAEKNREGFSKEWLRLQLLLMGQVKTFRNSAGVIFISEYSQNYILQHYPKLLKNKVILKIPHGSLKVNQSFRKYAFKDIIRLLYVSTVKKYKHQWNLIDAVSKLRQQGFPLELHLIGSGDNPALKRMNKEIMRNSNFGKFVHYHGELSHNETLKWYRDVDLFAFASSCETFGISLLEAMSAGLPIACSDRGPMPEVLKDAGIYFNPEKPDTIMSSLKLLLEDESLRQTLGKKAHLFSHKYSWETCAIETFSFLSSVNQRYFS